MQTKEQKYTAAVERNLRGAAKDRFKETTLTEAKIKLGIRRSDEKYDTQIKDVFALKNEKEKNE